MSNLIKFAVTTVLLLFSSACLVQSIHTQVHVNVELENNNVVHHNNHHYTETAPLELDDATYNEADLTRTTHLLGSKNPSFVHHSSAPNSVKQLGIEAKGDRTDFKLNSYGAKYKTNKNRIISALKQAGLNEASQKFFLAIGMLETNSFESSDRDSSKTGDSTNYSAFNINRDMLNYIHTSLKDYNVLNSWSGLGKVVTVLKLAVHKLGINNFLDFHRGGRQGFEDHVSYGCAAYRETIATIMRQFDHDPTLLFDDRRVDISLDHV